MSPELSQKLASAVDGMPAFPKSVQSILELTRDVNCTPKDLVQVIDKDPVVTVKVLRAVNSAYYSLPKQITSVNHAVVYLGFNTIKNLALCIAAIGILPQHNSAEFDVNSYLLHSLSTAVLAKKLAARLDDVDPMDCFIGGLLHDFGKVVCAQFMPTEFKQALQLSLAQNTSLHEALRHTLGADHAIIGAMLVEKWRFAPDLIHTIAHQFDPPAQNSALFACVFTANQISKKLSFGFAGNPCVYPLSPPVAKMMGGTLDEVILSLNDVNAAFEEAKLFAQI
ncbi:HDOD domain-containing protein [Rhodoferax sp.]|uniref:HDOD domain-containing protein n=1 Tax=Rhodoferax sp. TaxID=50421 RepID=UPI00261C7DF5|nr:HDOD domain-containing protein [Rhodoferax sp.]MDD5479827.1 HDOD domain-containing protein [Rhodoferax sp.]